MNDRRYNRSGVSVANLLQGGNDAEGAVPTPTRSPPVRVSRGLPQLITQFVEPRGPGTDPSEAECRSTRPFDEGIQYQPDGRLIKRKTIDERRKRHYATAA